MKFSLPKQVAILGACAVLSLTVVARADDQRGTSRTRPARNARLALPSEHSAVNSQTTDTRAPRNISAGGTTGTETRAVTGTNITKTYRRFGHTTDSAQPVYVIDRDDPRFYSRGTLAGALRGLPFASTGR